MSRYMINNDISQFIKTLSFHTITSVELNKNRQNLTHGFGDHGVVVRQTCRVFETSMIFFTLFYPNFDKKFDKKFIEKRLTHGFGDDGVVVWHLVGVDGLQERPRHLVALKKAKVKVKDNVK